MVTYKLVAEFAANSITTQLPHSISEYLDGVIFEENLLPISCTQLCCMLNKHRVSYEFRQSMSKYLSGLYTLKILKKEQRLDFWRNVIDGYVAAPARYDYMHQELFDWDSLYDDYIHVLPSDVSRPEWVIRN